MDILKALASTKLEARPYQQRIVSKVLKGFLTKGLRSIMINSPTGCLVGDTEVVINLGGKSKRFTMREAYLHFHGSDKDAEYGECLCGCGERTRVPQSTDRSKRQVGGIPLRFVHGHQTRATRWENTPYIRSFRGEHGFGRQRVLDIVKSGVKKVYRLTLTDGKELRGTECHQIMTVDGWVPLGQLVAGTAVMVDNVCCKHKDDLKAKPRDEFIWNVWNHPFGRRVKTKKEKRGYSIRVPMHVAIFEAAHNGLSLDEYTDIVRHGDPSMLKLVDPSTDVIHHIDHDHYNNDPGNLQLMSTIGHLRYHGDAEHFGMSVPEWANVESVTADGDEMTYDICCEQPYHNFVANGIVVHNSGKTSMGLLAVKMLQDAIPGLEVGWVAMRRNLLSQAVDENTRMAIGATITPISMFASEMPDSLMKAEKRMLVVDESHHDATNSMAHIHATVKPDYVLGMSATGWRSDRVKLCFDTVINDASIGALIRDGYLSEYEHYTIPNWSVQDTIQVYLREQERWGKSIFYYHTLDQCAQARELLEDNGVPCEMVTGDSDREIQLERFGNGDVNVIVNCMVLTEGFDCPSLQTVFIRPSCKGLTIQMAGRAFRKHPDVHVKRIVQCEKTKWPFVKTADPVCSYKWDPPSDTHPGQWLSLTPNKHINAMNCKMLMTLATIETKLPDFMVKKQMSKKGRRAKKRF